MPFRIGLDVLCFGDERGGVLLKKIVEQCNAAKRPPPAVFKYSGEAAVPYDSLASIAMNQFARRNIEFDLAERRPNIAAAIRARCNHNDYYGQTLAGFALALDAKRYVRICDAATRRR